MSTTLLSRPVKNQSSISTNHTYPHTHPAKTRQAVQHFGLVLDQKTGRVMGRLFVQNTNPVLPPQAVITFTRYFKNGKSLFLEMPTYQGLLDLLPNLDKYGWTLNQFSGNESTTYQLASILQAHLDEFNSRMMECIPTKNQALYNLLREQREGHLIHPENLK
jgi:hypothetical protein